MPKHSTQVSQACTVSNKQWWTQLDLGLHTVEPHQGNLLSFASTADGCGAFVDSAWMRTRATLSRRAAAGGSKTGTLASGPLVKHNLSEIAAA